MFIISKLNLVKIKYKMYKNLLFIKNNYWRTYVRLKTYEHYNINTRVLRAVLQSDNNGLPDWFIYMATYSEGHCLLFQNTRGIKSRTKQILFDRTLGQSAKLYEYTHTHTTNGQTLMNTAFSTAYFIPFYYVPVHILPQNTSLYLRSLAPQSFY